MKATKITVEFDEGPPIVFVPKVYCCEITQDRQFYTDEGTADPVPGELSVSIKFVCEERKA